MFPGVILAQVR